MSGRDHRASGSSGSARPAETGTFVFSADRPLGPFSPPDPIAPPDGPLGTLYAGKLVEVERWRWRFIAFRGDGDRNFLGELTDPFPLRFDEYGELQTRGRARSFRRVGARCPSLS